MAPGEDFLKWVASGCGNKNRGISGLVCCRSIADKSRTLPALEIRHFNLWWCRNCNVHSTNDYLGFLRLGRSRQSYMGTGVAINLEQESHRLGRDASVPEALQPCLCQMQALLQPPVEAQSRFTTVTQDLTAPSGEKRFL